MLGCCIHSLPMLLLVSKCACSCWAGLPAITSSRSADQCTVFTCLLNNFTGSGVALLPATGVRSSILSTVCVFTTHLYATCLEFGLVYMREGPLLLRPKLRVRWMLQFRVGEEWRKLLGRGVHSRSLLRCTNYHRQHAVCASTN